MKYLIPALAVFCLVGCNYTPTSDDKLNAQQEQISLQATNAVGMPAITKFAEKRMMKTILEDRDKEVATFTYIVDLNGHLHLLCNSVGYGLPYATQYTNPSKLVHPYSGVALSMPQADPNGLFSPASADGTWVQCLNPETKLSTVVYIEPRVIVSPFKLNM